MPCLLVVSSSGEVFKSVHAVCSSVGWRSFPEKLDDCWSGGGDFDAVVVDCVHQADGADEIVQEIAERSPFMPLVFLSEEPAPVAEFGDGLRYYVNPGQLVDLEHILISLTCGFTGSFSPPSPAGQRVPRVLIVDDNLELAGLIERSLRSLERYDVRVTGSGFEAASILPTFSPDVVVIDLVLDDIDGREVCTFIRNDRRMDKTRIIGVSGYLPEGCASDKKGLFDVYLEKPFRVKDVVDRIVSLVQK